MNIISKFKRLLRHILIETGLLDISFPSPLLLDISCSERIVEYAWVLKNLNLEKRKILDIGCGGTLFPIMLASLGYEVIGIALENYEYKHPHFKFIKCDILNPPEYLLNNKFDVIISISSIEHAGFWERKIWDENGDIKAIQVIKGLLNDEGIVFLSAGFGGKYQIHYKPENPEIPFGRLYDEERLKALYKDFEILKREYFIKDESSCWQPSNFDEISKISYPREWNDTRSIFCIKMKKLK